MTTHSRRGVLGGAKTMRQKPRWRQIRDERIAQQKEEREAVAAEAAEEEEEEETAAATPREKKGKNAMHVKETARRAVSTAGRFGWLPTMNSNRWTAVLIWLVGAYLTRAFLMQVGIVEEYATPIGLVLQWLLTKGESPLWQGNGRPPLAIICTLIDGGMNSAGALVYTKNIGSTDVWSMIQYAAQDPALTPSITTQVMLAIAVGLIVAAAAEYYWNL